MIHYSTLKKKKEETIIITTRYSTENKEAEIEHNNREGWRWRWCDVVVVEKKKRTTKERNEII